MEHKICGQNPTSIAAAKSSPFSRIIALGWYDGPTYGAIQCSACPDAYAFQIVDRDFNGDFDRRGWDQGRELRIVSLAPLSPGGFNMLIDVLSQKEPPTWPIWAPSWTFSDVAQQGKLESSIDAILTDVAATRFVIASHSLLEDVQRVRELTPEEAHITKDWFAFLGIEKEAD